MWNKIATIKFFPSTFWLNTKAKHKYITDKIADRNHWPTDPNITQPKNDVILNFWFLMLMQ